MEAASFHESYTDDDLQFTDDFRACSPFQAQEYACNTIYLDDITHQNCKNSCDSDNCNTNPFARGQTCYTCTATRNSLGESVGTSDDRCFDAVRTS